MPRAWSEAIFRLTAEWARALAAVDAGDPSPWSRARMKAELANPRNLCLGCRAADGLGGFIIVHSVADEAEITRFAVRNDLRRRGMGAALLRAGLDAAAARGAARVFLEARAGNRAAIALYEKNGFRLTGRRRNYYKDREDAVCMTAVINHNPPPELRTPR